MTRSRDALFWRDTLPHLVTLYPALRHLVVAIASTHELLSTTDAESLNVFALQHCTRATQLLLASNDLSLSLLLASCILVSAYHLLRGDMTSADLSIESGVKMGNKAADGTLASSLRVILARLGKQHAFKLWAPDVVCRFDKSALTAGPLVLEVDDCINGPFTNLAQILAAFKWISLEVVAAISRNLAMGAYVDPDSALAREVSRQLGSFAHYWDIYAAACADDDERLELLQLRIGLYNISILFHAKLIGPGDLSFDAFCPDYEQMLALAEEVISARHSGQTVVYVERMVNGALFTMGMLCRDPVLRRRALTLLQSQARYDEGLVNWLRGMVIETITRVEERGLEVHCSADIPLHRRIYMSGIRCRDLDKAVCLSYVRTDMEWGVGDLEKWSDWDSYSSISHLLSEGRNDVSAHEIDVHLQGIVAACRMYNKALSAHAPRGFVRQMFFRGVAVPILWEEGRGPHLSGNHRTRHLGE